MAEAFTRRALSKRGSDITVSSSGSLEPGFPPPDEVIELMTDRGIDVAAHRSRRFDADVIGRADLILGMERRHLTEIVAIDADAYTRTFTLIEFLHRLDGLDDEPRDLPTTLELIAQDRGRRDLLRVTMDQEIPDPMGRSTKFFERVADQIEGLVDHMVAQLWPLGETTPAGRI